AASTVTLVKTGNGSLLVTSTPAGINFGPGAANDCSETFTAVNAVTLIATVPTGTVFGGWGGDCAFRNMNLSCPLGTINGTTDRLGRGRPELHVLSGAQTRTTTPHT